MRHIPLLVPHIPSWDDLRPWIAGIDERRQYTNNGPLVRELEDRLAAFLDIPHVIAVSSGTSGLALCAEAQAWKRGWMEQVACPTFTFPATVQAIAPHVAQEVLLVDCRNGWYAWREDEGDTMMPKIPVAPLGLSCPIPCGALYVDAAGSLLNWPKGHAPVPLVFSLHATKPLPAVEGGIIATHDEGLAETMRQMRSFGHPTSDVASSLWGTNAKMSEYHAAVALSVLDHLPRIDEKLRGIVGAYADVLKPLGITSPHFDPPCATTMLAVEIHEHNRDRVEQHLTVCGVETRRWYTPLMHQWMWKTWRSRDSYPKAEALQSRLLGLPCHMSLSLKDVHYVCEQIGVALL